MGPNPHRQRVGDRACATATGCGATLTAGHGADDEEGFEAFDDRIGQLGFGRLVRDVFFASEEADKGAAFQGAVVANGAAQDRVAGFEGVDGGAESDGGWDVELHFGVRDTGQIAQVIWERDADHPIGRVNG